MFGVVHVDRVTGEVNGGRQAEVVHVVGNVMLKASVDACSQKIPWVISYQRGVGDSRDTCVSEALVFSVRTSHKFIIVTMSAARVQNAS